MFETERATEVQCTVLDLQANLGKPRVQRRAKPHSSLRLKDASMLLTSLNFQVESQEKIE